VIEVLESYANFLAEDSTVDFVQIPDMFMAVDALKRLGKHGANPFPVDDKFVEMVQALSTACAHWLREQKPCEECILYQLTEKFCWLSEVQTAIVKERVIKDGDDHGQQPG
jgi:hypothetical protein